MCQAYEAERAWITTCEHAAALRGFAAAYFQSGTKTRGPSYLTEWDHGFRCYAERITPYAVECWMDEIMTQKFGNSYDWYKFRNNANTVLKETGKLPKIVETELKRYV